MHFAQFFTKDAIAIEIILPFIIAHGYSVQTMNPNSSTALNAVQKMVSMKPIERSILDV